MYKRTTSGWIKHLDFMVLDLIILELSFVIAYAIRMGDLMIFPLPYIYRQLMITIIPAHIITAFFSNSYSGIVRRDRFEEFKKVFIHCFITIALIVLWMFAQQNSVFYSRIAVISMFPVSVILMMAERIGWKRVIRLRRKDSVKERQILLITNKDSAEKIIHKLCVDPYRDYDFMGVVLFDDYGKMGDKIAGVPVVTEMKNINTYVSKNVVDELVINLENSDRTAENLMRKFVSAGLTVHVVLSQFTKPIRNRQVQNVGDIKMISSSLSMVSPSQLAIKRLMDIVGALVGLVFTGIACIIFGPIIKHQSPGPMFFAQERVGRNGRTFKIYKFRTMYPDAEERKKELMAQNKMSGLMFKMDNDPRIIPIGHFLRKSSIDELPQFFNVLKGDMSLVGTRPPTLDEYKQYDIHHLRRLAAKPGLTGMWQASGRSEITDFEEVVRLDTYYIENWSLGLDIKLILKTIKVVLTRKGAE